MLFRSNLLIPPQELTSFAWPCGETTPQEEQMASQYYISARGYFINQLEDVNPADFMNLKSFNTPGYNPGYYPPPLKDVADSAESQGKWANFVFHDSCNDGGVIDYLATKYVRERQNSTIGNLTNTASSIKFNLVNNQDHSLYNQELSLKVAIGEGITQSLKINNVSKSFTLSTGNGTNYIEIGRASCRERV